MPLPRARKSLGQHFLTDPRILDRIAAALDPAPGDLVVEIGAGTGTLTRVLAARVGTVIAIEKDGRLASECGMRNAERDGSRDSGGEGPERPTFSAQRSTFEGRQDS